MVTTCMLRGVTPRKEMMKRNIRINSNKITIQYQYQKVGRHIEHQASFWYIGTSIEDKHNIKH